MVDNIFPEANGLIEIDDLQLTLAVEGDVGWLDVPMGHTHRLQIVEALSNLIHNLLHQLVAFVLEEDALDIFEASLLAGLEDKEQLVFLPDHEVDEVDHPRVREVFEDSD